MRLLMMIFLRESLRRRAEFCPRVGACEMGRPDWRTMLAGMTSTEYADWHRFYRTHYFHDTQLDMHFSGLMYAVLSLFCDPDMHPADFSLLCTPT